MQLSGMIAELEMTLRTMLGVYANHVSVVVSGYDDV